ncbi:helix-turn-helix transcriptional regulator [Desulfomonile tiedjei]|uniref:Putative transcription factor, MBF1 like protein n=1 Tax=Desulfomonile tiedjei (strain ATCC 49306 / DSM 6799 / DCB-1) TaxID=706587 RepID=I4CDU0_DESTA|nr:helix-turn-helix domain-containing protein [Desulfomonile tiedjei]AFM27731.1 putative transcription factor, MBF1 like protein [Desulfomonile tiedjei DSM 6799]
MLLLTYVRKQKGWSQETLAKEIGYNARHLRLIESGKYSPEKASNRLKEALEMVFDFPASSLLSPLKVDI